MSYQKKNRTLLLVLVALVVISLTLNFFGGDRSNNLEIDRATYQIANTLNINRIESNSPSGTTQLTFSGGKWILNSTFEADPSRVHLLFAAIQQVSVRRPVSNIKKGSIDSLFQTDGSQISFYEGENLIKSISSAGDESNNITYFKSGEDFYIVEIPGYRTFIHGLVNVEFDSWRNMNLLHRMNWRNLGSINVSYPTSGEEGFSISRINDLFQIEGAVETDTTKLFDYIDYISLLNAEEYLDDDQEGVVTMKIDVRDIGNRSFTLELFDAKTTEGRRIGRMDSSYYFSIEEGRVDPIFVGPEDFKK